MVESQLLTSSEAFLSIAPGTLICPPAPCLAQKKTVNRWDRLIPAHGHLQLISLLSRWRCVSLPPFSRSCPRACTPSPLEPTAARVLLYLPNLHRSGRALLVDAPDQQALVTSSNLKIIAQQDFSDMPARLRTDLLLRIMKIAALCNRANLAPSVLPMGLKKASFTQLPLFSKECNKTSQTGIEAIDICQVHV